MAIAAVAPPLPELVSFLEQLPEPHILCDREYRILAANAAYRKQCGGSRNVVGRSCFEVSHRYAVPCDRAGESCPLARSLDSGQRERVLHLHHTPSGEAYENIELTPLRDATGEVAYFIEKLEPLPIARGADNAKSLSGSSPAFTRLLHLVARVAPSDASVLLQGESGTGKELVAQAIHDASRRAARPFVVVDCSGLPETLFESELFGHERGAFTGAATRKPGLIEAASGGTLFLDEVGDIPLSMQVKLLRLLETGTYRRVGGVELRRADVRLISATHRALAERVRDGRFRQDLYYRLNTFPIPVPALRERRSDLPQLIATLLARVAPRRQLAVAPAALALLEAYDYPGNVRELRNLLERASLMCDGELITDLHLPEETRRPAGSGALPPGGAAPALVPAGAASWRDLEQETLRALLAEHRGTRRALAARLGISERTLYRKIRQSGS
ncbi:MAG: sigma-54-dependent Fis family transcriptional regulator [Betaproteobacteria bacterium]|nr:sigma-54-dependent Fis family transcriptional regulator [Betaproteobacteria bacterium]